MVQYNEDSLVSLPGINQSMRSIETSADVMHSLIIDRSMLSFNNSSFHRLLLKSSNAPFTCRPDGSHLVSKPWVYTFVYWYNGQRWKCAAVWIAFPCKSDLFEVPCIWKLCFFCIFMIQQSCVLENMSYTSDSLLVHHCNILIQHIQKYYSRFYC